MLKLYGTPQGGTTDDHSGISDNDAATDVTGAELEELTDASETALHSHAEAGTTDTHADISANDGDTDVTGAELEELTDASETTLHSHAGGGETFVDRGDPAAVDWDIGSGIIDDTTVRVLDMSAVVPAAAANKLVLLRVAATGSALGAAKFTIKENGLTNSFNGIEVDISVTAQRNPRSSELVRVDADRKVQYKASASLTEASITVRGWWL